MSSSNESAALSRLIRAVGTRDAAPRWQAARACIGTERAAVLERLRARPDSPVYGFTTLLGPLDSRSADELTPAEILESHLVGTPVTLPPFWRHAIHGAKLEQMSHGGSGVSIESFDAVLGAFGQQRTLEMDLSASYGSGDVVPGCWWVAGVLGRAPKPRGDLIALMNGSFVGLGISLGAVLRLEQHLPEALAVLLSRGRVQTGTTAGGDRELLELLKPLQRRGCGTVQLPVSLRDAGASILPLIAATAAAETAIAARLGAPSANPLFLLRNGEAEAFSQSSFLSLDVRFALEGLISATVMLGGLMQRALESHHDRGADGIDTAQVSLIQPAKVVHALYLEMLGSIAPYGFVGVMSGGVEDLWDGVLYRARQLDALVSLLERQLSVIRDVVGAARGVDLVRDALSRRLQGTALDVDFGALTPLPR